MDPFMGIILHSIGGLAAGSFYLPFKKVRNWAWESYWLAGGFFSWIIVPWLVAFLTVPELISILTQSPVRSVAACYIFGVLWGVGGVTFGLSMRYLGMSLGYALTLGFCAAFGTIIPPILGGTIVEVASEASGQMTILGIIICLGGIGICGWAGMSKEKELPDDKKKESIKEFDFKKGLWVAVFAGVMSSCMALGIDAGKPIAELAVEKGVAPLWQNSPVFVCILAGGFTTNFLWCLYLNLKNRSVKDYVKTAETPLLWNYLFCALAGTTWYLQFMFYGMGTTKMGKYSFSSWTIHMAFIIVFSNIWGLVLREWKGSSRKTHQKIFAGIIVLILSTIVVGLGNYIASQKQHDNVEDLTWQKKAILQEPMR